jgi:hypothetical protein
MSEADIGNRLRLDEIGQIAGQAASYWDSIVLAADRGDTLTVNVHLAQIVLITRSVIALVKELGEEGQP